MPDFPTSSLEIHWGAPNPATFVGTFEETKEQFKRTFAMLKKTIERLSHVPLGEVLQEELKIQIKAIKFD